MKIAWRGIFSFILCFLLTVWEISTWAQDQPVIKDKDKAKESVPKTLGADKTSDENAVPTWEENLITDDILISDWFNSTADGLDLFLVGRRITDKPNQSSLKIGSSVYSKEGAGVTNSTNFATNLSLPNLEEYWHLKFTNYDDQADERGVRRNYLRETPQPTNYGASVGLFKKLGNIRTSFEPRVQLSNPVKISHSLAFQSVADYQTYKVNPKVEFYASADTGTGVFQSLDFNIKYSKVYSLTFINEGDYQDKNHYYYVTNGLILGQAFTEKMGLSYSAMFGFHNHTNYHLDNYILAVTWSHLLFKNILDYQITPHWDFVDAIGFVGRIGLTFSFSLTF